MKFKLTPIQQCFTFLVLMAMGAVGWWVFNMLTTENWATIEKDPLALKIAAVVLGLSLLVFILHLAVTLGWAIVLRAIFSKLTGRHKNLEDTLITGLILFLLLNFWNVKANNGGGLSNQMHLLHALVATTFAMAIKVWGMWKGMPVMNPAVGGLLLTILLFQSVLGLNAPFISWWGTDFGGLVSLVLVLGWIVLGLKKWRKYPLLLSFLVSHAALLFFQEKIDFLTYSFTHSTLYFMASIMLIEPKTSPSMKKDQIGYGILAAVAYNLFLSLAIPYAELWTIVLTNGFYLLLKMKRMGIESWKV